MSKQLGVIAVFKTEEDILKAAETTRQKKGFNKWDTFTPYPIHGMDDAMGIKRSFLPWVTFVAGATGLVTALALQIGTSAIDWPINIGGKPMISLPAFIPVTFELTVLFAGLCTVGALFYVCGLPALKAPILDPAITNDRFVLFVSAEDPKYSESEVKTFFGTLGAERVTTVSAES
jgi:hypothetical protein